MNINSLQTRYFNNLDNIETILYWDITFENPLLRVKYKNLSKNGINVFTEEEIEVLESYFVGNIDNKKDKQ